MCFPLPFFGSFHLESFFNSWIWSSSFSKLRGFFVPSWYNTWLFMEIAIWQQCENWYSFLIKQQIGLLKPQEMHQFMMVVAVCLLSSFQGKKRQDPKHPPQPSARKSNPDIIQNAKTIPSPKIVLLTWSTFPNGSTQKREQRSFFPFPGSSCATESEVVSSAGNVLWVSVCPVVVSVGFVLHGEACFRSAACCSC